MECMAGCRQGSEPMTLVSPVDRTCVCAAHEVEDCVRQSHIMSHMRMVRGRSVGVVLETSCVRLYSAEGQKEVSVYGEGTTFGYRQFTQNDRLA